MQGLLLDNMNEDSLTEECRITQSLPMFICNYVRRVHFVRWQNVELYVIIVVLKEFLICLIMILLQVFDERHISSSYPEVWFEEHRELITGTRIISHRYKYFCQPITKSEHNFANGTCNKYKKMIFSHQEYYGLTRLHLRELDGCPAHYGRQVRQWLNGHYTERWIGRGSPISWPPKSPDLTPFFYLCQTSTCGGQ
ncbi:uncharacterized protein LOC105185812 isoform X1 [Harpegnathos saltator]|uniref:uncharacterized protein LOC105185812 isoform X1 n=1 Tax=Harpegnathos saltator TaxID=610380 RepID=UPI000DBEDC0E|nr:uncharacterized protein LOC105185812 isoform X1 [Harpegnathos saltator]